MWISSDFVEVNNTRKTIDGKYNGTSISFFVPELRWLCAHLKSTARQRSLGFIFAYHLENEFGWKKSG